jgi:hypothetical protein
MTPWLKVIENFHIARANQTSYSLFRFRTFSISPDCFSRTSSVSNIWRLMLVNNAHHCWSAQIEVTWGQGSTADEFDKLYCNKICSTLGKSKWISQQVRRILIYNWKWVDCAWIKHPNLAPFASLVRWCNADYCGWRYTHNYIQHNIHWCT